MFWNFRQRNLIRFSNFMYFKGQEFHMSYPNVCAAIPSLKNLTGTILDFTNFVKIIGTVTDCEPIVDGFKYTVTQVDNISKNKIIEHKLVVSTHGRSNLASTMLKNGQRINVDGYIRSYSFSKTLRLSNVLAGCRISIIPKTVQVSEDAINYTDKCIAILQGLVRSDVKFDKDRCKFVLETITNKRNELGDIIDKNISTYHLIIITEPKLRKFFEKTIRKYDDVILEGHIDYFDSVNSIGAIYPYKCSKIDRMAFIANEPDDDEH